MGSEKVEQINDNGLMQAIGARNPFRPRMPPWKRFECAGFAGT